LVYFTIYMQAACRASSSQSRRMQPACMRFC